MLSGALFVFFVLGLTAGSPLRRQDGGGKFGYEYDVKHPGGNSRVHVRAGGDQHRNSYPRSNLHNAEYVSDASYVNPHYVEPLYQPNRYGQYPPSYNRVPLHGQIRGNVPVYEEHSRYPKPAAYHAHNAYGIHDKPSIAIDSGYRNPQFVQQAGIDDSTLFHPPSKIEQVPFDPKPTYDVVPPFEKVEQIPSEPFVVKQIASDLPESQLHLEEDSPVIVPNPPIDQQALVDEPEIIPVISQEPLDDKLSQVVEDIPPPKVVVLEPESPIVQQASVDVPPPIIDDEVVAQIPLGAKPIDEINEPPVVQQVSVDEADSFPVQPLLHGAEHPVIQTTIDNYPPQTSVEPSFAGIDHHSPTQLFAAQPKYHFVPVGPPYQKISHSTEIIHGPSRSLHSPNYQPVKLPPPRPVTKSIVPAVLHHQQEHIDEPLYPPVSPSVKLPPAPLPVTKSIVPVVLPNQQEHIDEPLYPPVSPSVKLPPAPLPVTKSIEPVVLLDQQEHIEEPLYPPVSASVKLPPPPPPVTKSVSPIVPAVLPHVQEHIEVPLTKNPPISVKLPPPAPITKSVIPAVLQPVQEPVDIILTKNPPLPHSVKLPPAPLPVYKSPPLYKPIGGIKTSPYGKVPVAGYHPVPHSGRQPYANSYHIKTPYVSKPPLTYVPFTKSPVPYSVKRSYAPPPAFHNPNLHYGNPHIKSQYFRPPVTKTVPISYGVKQPVVSNFHSVKHPKAVAAVKGYPHVKVPPAAPHFGQSSYVEEPLLETPPIPHSIKHPQNSVPVLYDSPVGNPHLKLPPQPEGPVKKYLPVGHGVKLPYSKLEEGTGISPEIPYPSEEKSPLQKYPPVSHAFQIAPVISPPGPKSELPATIEDIELSGIDSTGPSPLDKSPPVSHAIVLPASAPPAAQVPNLFASVPSLDDEASIETPLNEKEPVSHAIILPSSVSEPKVSSLRSDALSSPVSHPVRLRDPRNRRRYGEPKQGFPAFPVESAYGHPDPVSEKVSHLSNSFNPAGSHVNSRYEPDESESSNSPSVEEAKLEIARVNKEIGASFGDRIPAHSRLS